MDENASLFRYCPSKSRMTMAQGTSRYSRYEIEILAAVGVPHPATAASGEHQRRSAVCVENVSTSHGHEVIGAHNSASFLKNVHAHALKKENRPACPVGICRHRGTGFDRTVRLVRLRLLVQIPGGFSRTISVPIP